MRKGSNEKTWIQGLKYNTTSGGGEGTAVHVSTVSTTLKCKI